MGVGYGGNNTLYLKSRPDEAIGNGVLLALGGSPKKLLKVSEARSTLARLLLRPHQTVRHAQDHPQASPQGETRRQSGKPRKMKLKNKTEHNNVFNHIHNAQSAIVQLYKFTVYPSY